MARVLFAILLLGIFVGPESAFAQTAEQRCLDGCFRYCSKPGNTAGTNGYNYCINRCSSRCRDNRSENNSPMLSTGDANRDTFGILVRSVAGHEALKID